MHTTIAFKEEGEGEEIMTYIITTNAWQSALSLSLSLSDLSLSLSLSLSDSRPPRIDHNTKPDYTNIKTKGQSIRTLQTSSCACELDSLSDSLPLFEISLCIQIIYWPFKWVFHQIITPEAQKSALLDLKWYPLSLNPPPKSYWLYSIYSTKFSTCHQQHYKFHKLTINCVGRKTYNRTS